MIIKREIRLIEENGRLSLCMFFVFESKEDEKEEERYKYIFTYIVVLKLEQQIE